MKIYTCKTSYYHGNKGFVLGEEYFIQGYPKKDKEHLRQYVEEYYESVLKNKTPGELILELEEKSVILSDEDAKDYGPRELIAVWLELYYGQDVREVKSLEDGTLKTLPRNKYHIMIKEMLDTLIKQNIDMHGYTSVVAAHAYNQAMKVADKKELCNNLGISQEVYLKIADALENTYGENQQKDRA